MIFVLSCWSKAFFISQSYNRQLWKFSRDRFLSLLIPETSKTQFQRETFEFQLTFCMAKWQFAVCHLTFRSLQSIERSRKQTKNTDCLKIRRDAVKAVPKLARKFSEPESCFLLFC